MNFGPLHLQTINENIQNNKKIDGYRKYDNFNAIDIKYVSAIPSDYDGIIGVPLSFLDKYCPEQFEIVGARYGIDGKYLTFTKENKKVTPYFRILVQKKCLTFPN